MANTPALTGTLANWHTVVHWQTYWHTPKHTGTLQCTNKHTHQHTPTHCAAAAERLHCRWPTQIGKLGVGEHILMLLPGNTHGWQPLLQKLNLRKITLQNTLASSWLSCTRWPIHSSVFFKSVFSKVYSSKKYFIQHFCLVFLIFQQCLLVAKRWANKILPQSQFLTEVYHWSGCSLIYSSPEGEERGLQGVNKWGFGVSEHHCTFNCLQSA